jgi:alpha/beta superfamily hydrolase
MDMELMVAIEEALVEAGFATLRYNSRGVGRSGGTISQVEAKKLVVPEGEAEMLDVGAALAFLGGQSGVNGEKLALVGHSFGARIALAYLAAHPEERSVAAVACIGLAVAWRDLSYLGQWPHPKLFVTAERDDFSPPEMLKEFVAKLPEPANVVALKRTGHFFEGRERDLAGVVATFVRRVIS